MNDWIPEDTHKEHLSLYVISCIDVAIEYNGKILLIRRGQEPAKGQWWLPGGLHRKGETRENCALRKAIQETGLYCKLGPIIHHSETIFETVHSVNFVYKLYANSDNVKLDDTSVGYKWVTQADDYHPYVRVSLIKAMFCL